MDNVKTHEDAVKYARLQHYKRSDTKAALYVGAIFHQIQLACVQFSEIGIKRYSRQISRFARDCNCISS